MICSICLNEIESKKYCFKLECGHYFHRKCMLEYINHVIDDINEDYLQKNTINCPNCRHSYIITSLMKDNKFYPYKCDSEKNIKKNLTFLLLDFTVNKNNLTLKEKKEKVINIILLFKKKYGEQLLKSNTKLKTVVEEKLKEFYYKDDIKPLYKIYRDIFKKRI